MTSHRRRVEHLLAGYLYVELLGQRAGEVVRELANSSVPMYQVRVRENVANIGFGLSDFATVYQVCHVRRVKIRFIRRAGFPFFVRKARRRKMLLLGSALFAALLFAFQSVVWHVEVSGVSPEDATAIVQAARASGVYPGAAISVARDVERLQTELQKRIPSLMWVGVNVQGTRVKIQALEKVPGVAVKSNQPHNIVAIRPAVIRKVLATRGSVQVQLGQVVQAGQVLVSGVLGGGEAEVPANGVVLAEVWYRSQVSVPLHVSQQALSGVDVQFDQIQLGKLNVRVWGWRVPRYAAWYDQTSDTTWKIGNWELPVLLRHTTRYEASPYAVAQSKQQALATILSIARQDVATLPGQDRVVLGQTVLHSEVTHGKLYATVLTRTEEDIGTPAPIPQAVPESEKSSN